MRTDSISHDKDSGILFASFKYVGYDYAGDMEKMRDNPKVREWWQMTDGWQEVRVAPVPPRFPAPPLRPLGDARYSLYYSSFTLRPRGEG